MRAVRATEFAAWIACAAIGSAAALGAAVLSEAERAKRIEQVRRAEIAFAATVPAKDTLRFADRIDPDAVFVGAGGPTRGRDAIVKSWAPFFAAEAPDFTWKPEIVELSGDGTLGLTRGPWTIRGRQPDGTASTQSGSFNSVWRRQADGSWKVIFDAGCPPCPQCPPPVPPPPAAQKPGG
jgi:uncharacterized protein (TIGR02246 family)